MFPTVLSVSDAFDEVVENYNGISAGQDTTADLFDEVANLGLDGD